MPEGATYEKEHRSHFRRNATACNLGFGPCPGGQPSTCTALLAESLSIKLSCYL